MPHVWTGNEVTVHVYGDDGRGNKLNSSWSGFNEGIDEPLLTYCFFRNAVVSSRNALQRREVTGRPHRLIVTDDFEYEMSVSHFYMKKSTELSLALIFNREHALQLDMFFEDANGGNEDSHHTLKIAYAESFEVSAEDNQNAEGRVKFQAEIFE